MKTAKEKQRIYQAANREKIRAQHHKWCVANREKRRASSRKWNAANPGKVCERTRERRGVPLPTRPMPELCEMNCGRKAKYLDHCHSTGVFRGWLCRGCNLGLGSLGDTAESLHNGLAYLARVGL
jgi:hypothetical protein